MRPVKNYKQIAALHDPARFSFWLAGRRGGKTTALLEDMKLHIPKLVKECPPDSSIVYVGPTNAMALELVWSKLEDEFIKMKWPHRALVSKQRFEFANRRSLFIIGAEKIRRVRGKKLYRAFIDELAFFDADLNEVWSKAIRPALSDLEGGARICTTPNGKGTSAYQFFREVQSNSEWTYHHWRTIDNPAIRETELEAAKRELDERAFNQEYCAEWQSFEGLAYYNFSENLHIKKQPPIDESIPLIIALDFNVNPTTLLLIQEQDGKIRVKREYCYKNSSTVATVKAFCEDFKDMAGRLRIKIRGDASGASRASTTGKSDYHYVKEMLSLYGFTFDYEVRAANPPIIDRVQHVNNYLLNARGETRLEIDPSCVEVINDFSGQQLEGRFPSDAGNLGHRADAIGYCVMIAFYNSISTRSHTIQL